ncbi:MAG: type II toxin-antitoxin system Phd/YefM family antitoxin [Candidatus Omnitrophota bacterium]
MKFVTVRDFRSKSAQIQKDLPKEKEMVLTSNGKPVAIFVSVTEKNLDESIEFIRRARAMAAVTSMQAKAYEIGADRMTLEDINREINSARKDHNRR